MQAVDLWSSGKGGEGMRSTLSPNWLARSKAKENHAMRAPDLVNAVGGGRDAAPKTGCMEAKQGKNAR